MNFDSPIEKPTHNETTKSPEKLTLDNLKEVVLDRK